MEGILLKISIVTIGILFTKLMLTKVLTNAQNKQNFTQEYLNILNNPEFKVKRSNE